MTEEYYKKILKTEKNFFFLHLFGPNCPIEFKSH